MALLIEYDQALVPDGGVDVCCSFTLTTHSNKDAAGHAFHKYALLQAGLGGSDSVAEDDASTAEVKSSASRASLLDDTIPEGVSWTGKKKKKKKDGSKLDYYKLLGLQNERWMATESDIKLAYRRVALEHHPDKAGAGITDEAEKAKIDEYFVQIQEAYANLSDPAKRREFDSIDEFDDTLPESCAPADFYKVFGPAFRRQARWSGQQPVPELGDDDAKDREVDRFYKFWFTFKSWREFPHPDEEDIEQAECREDRRYIERFNAKLREKAKKEEFKRLKAFVENAFNQDPRMVRRRQAEKDAKDARKKAKDEARQKGQKEAEATAAAEAKAKAEAEAAAALSTAEAKKARQAERKAMQKERSRLRTLIGGAEGGRLLDDWNMEQLCEKLILAQLRALREGLEQRAGDRGALLALCQENQVLIGQKVSQEETAKQQAAAAAEAQAAAARKAEEADRAARLSSWAEEEIRLLEKALVKYPVGTAKRWDQVAAYVRTRTVAEVIDMAKHGLKAGLGASKKPSFTPTGKRSGTDINSEATARHEVFTDVNVNLAPSAELANGGVRNGSAAPSANGATANGTSSTAASNGGASPAPAPATPPQSTAGPSGDWSDAQQLALVAAMKKHAKEVEDRWERIAAEVEGKTKAQCFKRFKELRQTIRAKKGS